MAAAFSLFVIAAIANGQPVEDPMKQLVKFKSPLHEMTQTTPTCLWNDSASLQELAYALDHGAVGATCNPVIVCDVLKKEMPLWKDRIEEMALATEDQIAWKVVEEISIKAAALLMPAFEQHRGINGRLSIQTDPRFYRDAKAILAQAVRFNALAPNMIVKIPVTKAGIAAIEEATYQGISINATVASQFRNASPSRKRSSVA
jgi:transaldolase